MPGMDTYWTEPSRTGHDWEMGPDGWRLIARPVAVVEYEAVA